ncbi:hypothetical protein C1I95_30305 [Micromonospora craterilacus]|uniref:Uncharacterized protein n=1 Tax=Micromonospora craterilacus TaxID=1655439 RepID=A0A2W2DB46_9ACTN|nr:hypothetical protein [Micromonospora craterilacus]PZG08103.1 hypothetical protein C1I95_30305 [Micromonospora craterilacus]
MELRSYPVHGWRYRSYSHQVTAQLARTLPMLTQAGVSVAQLAEAMGVTEQRVRDIRRQHHGPVPRIGEWPPRR